MSQTSTKPSTSQTLALYVAGARIMLHRLIRRIFGSSEPPPTDWVDARILLVGLDGAGKSSLTRRAGDSTAQLDASIASTSGFAVKTVTVLPHWRIELWEIGGAAAMRPFWPRYATQSTDGIAWVVDGADAARLSESAQALAELLRGAPSLRDLPLLVLVSKADLAAAASQSVDSVKAALGLDELARQGLSVGPLKVQLVSAADGRNLDESLCWVCAGGDERT